MYQINYNCFNEPFAVLLCCYLNLDMHGLIFETSIWLLAESTRLLHTLTEVSSKLASHEELLDQLISDY